MLLADIAGPTEPYLQYGALGILLAVLLAIFWKGFPAMGAFIRETIRENFTHLGNTIQNGFEALRSEAKGMETRHNEHMQHVNGRLDKIDTKIDTIGTKVETLVSRKDE